MVNNAPDCFLKPCAATRSRAAGGVLVILQRSKTLPIDRGRVFYQNTDSIFLILPKENDTVLKDRVVSIGVQNARFIPLLANPSWHAENVPARHPLPRDGLRLLIRVIPVEQLVCRQPQRRRHTIYRRQQSLSSVAK